jgi:hypothetical protein
MNRNIYVGNLSHDATGETIRGLLNPSVRQPQRELSKIRIVASPGGLIL